MTHSILLCIGIDEYQDRGINKLSYCAADCFRTERIFSIFNIADTFISLTNQNATRKKIIASLTSLSQNVDSLYIYYSAHAENIHQNSYLYTYDTNLKKIKTTSFPLRQLIEIVLQVNAKNITLILDACTIIIPPHQLDIVTILYPSSEFAYEDTVIKQGLFTKKILSSFAQQHYYKVINKKTSRYNRIRQDIAMFLERDNSVFIKGKSGLGKSHFLRKIKNEERYTFYISLPKVQDLTFNIVLSLINEEISLSSKDAQEKFIDADPERFIRFYTNIHPYCVIIIDHIDNLNQVSFKKLSHFLNELPSSKIIASQRVYKFIPQNIEYNFPILTKNDITVVIQEIGIVSKEYIAESQIYSCDTYIKLLDQIYNYSSDQPYHIKNAEALSKANQALALSGGFINQELFIKTFDLKREALEQLKQRGLIIFYDNFHYPHDSIYEDNIDPHVITLKKTACEYWKLEIKRDPSSSRAIQNFILLANTFSFNFSSEETQLYKMMISSMKGRQNSYFLLLLSEYLRDKKISSDLRIFLCEALVDIGKFDEANNLIVNSPLSNLKTSVLITELSWWRGKFFECIDISNNLLLQQPRIDITLRLLCSRGIGYFFLGKWDSSSKDLENIISNKKICDDKSIFLSYCVLATIQGLRGTNFNASVDNFICALEYAKKNGKLSWLALIYGNIGEILWKAGHYDKSIEILSISSHLSYLTDNEPLHLEINRNLLHAYHHSGKEGEEKRQLKKLENIFRRQSDNYVKMQIVNTLITHYIFVGNKNYKKYLLMAKQLTQDNEEYQIYTLSNLAIAELSENNLNSAIQNMDSALKLCFSGKNWLAMKQCLDDWDEIITSHHLDMNQAKQVFQKWHQILETELLPYLHHLSRLCEYLELP